MAYERLLAVCLLAVMRIGAVHGAMDTSAFGLSSDSEPDEASEVMKETECVPALTGSRSVKPAPKQPVPNSGRTTGGSSIFGRGKYTHSGGTDAAFDCSMFDFCANAS